MLLIPIVASDHKNLLLVVLEDENLERLHGYDPAEIDLAKLPGNFAGVPFHAIHVAYVSDADRGLLLDLMTSGKISDALALLSKGWKHRPELGDHDQPYTEMKGKVADA